MHRRMWPLNGPVDKPVFHRVPMAIIDMRLEIDFIADAMLPKPSMPDANLSLVDPYAGVNPGILPRHHAR